MVVSTVAKNKSLVFDIFYHCPQYLHQSDTLCDFVLAFPYLFIERQVTRFNKETVHVWQCMNTHNVCVECNLHGMVRFGSILSTVF